MLTELSQLSVLHAALLLAALAIVCVAVTVTASVVAVQWRKAHQAELGLAFKHEALQRGLLIGDGERPGGKESPIAAGPCPVEGPRVPPASPPVAARSAESKKVLIGLLCLTTFLAVSFFVVAIHEHSQQSSRTQSQMLTPDRPVVFVSPGGSASCRVYLNREDWHFQAEVQLIGAVIAQDNTESELRVEVSPANLDAGSPTELRHYCEVKLSAASGSGEFKVQVTAQGRYGRRAETSFTVRVRPPPPGGDSDRENRSPPEKLGESPC